MVRSTGNSKIMIVRRVSTTANGFVQQRNVRPRRRNAVANIFSELTEADLRILRQQAEMLHPAAMGATPPGSSSDSSSSEDLPHVGNLPGDRRRRRNALHDIGIGIDHAELQELRQQAQALNHPASMITTPPGAPCGGAEGRLRRTPRSVSMLLTAATGAVGYPDESGASVGPGLLDPTDDPSTIFSNIDDISCAVHASGSHFRRSISTTGGATSHHQSLSSTAATDAITITETDGDIFRERISRSSNRYRVRRNAVCYEDSTQVFLNNIISAVMRCRQQRRESAANKVSRLSESD